MSSVRHLIIHVYVMNIFLSFFKSGQYQVMDTGAMTSASLITHQIQAATGPITAFDISTSQQHVSFGDANGCFHLYASGITEDGSPKPFNPYSQETQFADVVSTIEFNIEYMYYNIFLRFIIYDNTGI